MPQAFSKVCQIHEIFTCTEEQSPFQTSEGEGSSCFLVNLITIDLNAKSNIIQSQRLNHSIPLSESRELRGESTEDLKPFAVFWYVITHDLDCISNRPDPIGQDITPPSTESHHIDERGAYKRQTHKWRQCQMIKQVQRSSLLRFRKTR